MIYIVDNGSYYSGHALYFFEFPDSVPEEEAERVILESPQAKHEAWDDPWKVVGCAPRIEWRDIRRTCWLLDWRDVSLLDSRSVADRNDWPMRYRDLMAWLNSCSVEVLDFLLQHAKDNQNPGNPDPPGGIAVLEEYVEGRKEDLKP